MVFTINEGDTEGEIKMVNRIAELREVQVHTEHGESPRAPNSLSSASVATQTARGGGGGALTQDSVPKMSLA